MQCQRHRDVGVRKQRWEPSSRTQLGATAWQSWEKELGLDVSKVGYHVTALAEAGLIEEIGRRPVRGAVEHFYRAVVRPITSDGDEAELTPEERTSFARTVWSLITANATTALEAGTLVERPDHHLTRVPLQVDEQGWSDLSAAYMELYERVYEIQTDSAGRLGAAPEEPGISVLSVLTFFETAEKGPAISLSEDQPAQS
jgi:hypothetical protein